MEGKGEVTTRDLVRNALRMRPDRIIVGECRGRSAGHAAGHEYGHEGSLTTIHANNPRDAISRLEMMVGMAGFDLPIWVIRRQIASAINHRGPGSPADRRPAQDHQISEVTGMEGDVISMHDIFEFVQTGLDEQRVAEVYFSADRHAPPECLPKLEG